MEQVRNEHLTKGPPRAAFALSILVGVRADVDQVVSAARAIAAVPERRALLLPLYSMLRDRDIDAAESVLGCCPSRWRVTWRVPSMKGVSCRMTCLRRLRRAWSARSGKGDRRLPGSLHGQRHGGADCFVRGVAPALATIEILPSWPQHDATNCNHAKHMSLAP